MSNIMSNNTTLCFESIYYLINVYNAYIIYGYFRKQFMLYNEINTFNSTQIMSMI